MADLGTSDLDLIRYMEVQEQQKKKASMREYFLAKTLYEIHEYILMAETTNIPRETRAQIIAKVKSLTEKGVKIDANNRRG